VQRRPVHAGHLQQAAQVARHIALRGQLDDETLVAGFLPHRLKQGQEVRLDGEASRAF
jgi:hypothetical protein